MRPGEVSGVGGVHLAGRVLVQELDVCEGEVSGPAVQFPDPLPVDVDLCDLRNEQAARSDCLSGSIVFFFIYLSW